MNKKEARVRRARKTRIRIALQRATRLVVSRSNCHIYAQIIAPTGDKVLASASTVEADVRKDVKNGGNKAAAAIVGKRIGDRAKALGIETVAFDRSGYRYHGRVQALADAAREAGLKFNGPQAHFVASPGGSRPLGRPGGRPDAATNRERSTWRECSSGSNSRTSAATASARR